MFPESTVCASLPLFLRLREKYFYHAWCYNGRPMGSLCLPPSLICSLLPLPPLSLSSSPPSVCQSPSLLHLYISIIPCSLETDEGAGQAVNVFFFFFCLYLSLSPSHYRPLSPKLSLIRPSFHVMYVCFSEAAALTHLSSALLAVHSVSIKFLNFTPLSWLILENTAVI